MCEGLIKNDSEHFMQYFKMDFMRLAADKVLNVRLIAAQVMALMKDNSDPDL